MQIVYNSKLKPTHVFSGDVVEAFHAACRVAANHYCTPTFQNADIVVVNAFPWCSQAGHPQEWIGRSVREGGTGVLIIQHPLTVDPVHYEGQAARGQKIHDYWVGQELGPQRRSSGNGAGLIVYSPYLTRTVMNGFRGAQFAATWDEVIQFLQQRHKGDARIAVYPYAGLQHQEIELDG